MTLKGYFKTIVKNKHLSHAYAFSGDNRNEKVDLTEYLVALLACEQSDDAIRPCGKCDTCQRIKEGNFPDMLFVEKDGQSVRVDQIRELKQWLFTTPVEADFKIAIIKDAESMNTSASNALLTVLEEPVENVYIILWVNHSSNLLPTIQSRVQTIFFDDKDYQGEQEEFIEQGYSSSQAMILSYFLSEETSLLLDNYTPESFEEWLKDYQLFYQKLVQQDKMSFVMVQTHLKKHFKPSTLSLMGADYLLFLNYHFMLHLIGMTAEEKLPSIYDKLFSHLKSSKQPPIQHLVELNQHLLNTKQAIQANVSAQLAYEQLSIKTNK